MVLDARHELAIQLLITHRFDGREVRDIAKEIGVQDRTLRKWRKDEAFERAYDEAFEDWKSSLEDIAYTIRRCRIEELVRLYKATPDTGTEHWAPDAMISALKREYKNNVAEFEGNGAEDVEPIDIPDEILGPIRRIHINAAVKALLMKQIAMECGDWAEKHEHSGSEGGVITFAELVSRAAESEERASNGELAPSSP